MKSVKHFGRFGQRFLRSKSVLTLAIAGLCMPGIVKGQATITVTTLADALSVAGQTTLRGAIQTADSASGTDTIQFAPGLFNSGSAAMNMAGTEFPISNSVNIDGPGPSNLTINAQQLSRVFDITNSSAQVSLSGMTLTNGLASSTSNAAAGCGGAIYNRGQLTVQNVIFSKNQSQPNAVATDTVLFGGGAIYNLNNLTVQNSVFTNNSTSVSGGGILSSGGTANVSGSTFTGNTDSDSLIGPGGSIGANYGAKLTFTNSTADNAINTRYFNTNPASSMTMTGSQVGSLYLFGTSNISNSSTGNISAVETLNISKSTVGAITTGNYVGNGNLTVTTSTLAQLNQSAGSASITASTFKAASSGTFAVNVGNGTTFLENDTVTGFNYTGGNGTLYFANGGSATIRNSTIAGNSAARGGGIFVANGDLNMDSTIVADNTATTISNDLSGYVSGQNNLVGDPTGAFLLSSSNLTGVNPDLGPLFNNGGPTETMALTTGSPAINAGSNLDSLPYDQRGAGYSRDSGGAVDIGAYQVQVPEVSSLPMLCAAGLPLLWRGRLRRPKSWR